ncbi:TIGR03557 family F420-dependent LLM class oxidoreductase [Spiractinospora alimapuensis]|uniref:TIGR03557 family F420-dependent LLM class oxidoreductase n=1 Tax=Spiractinospora alimapuensis TaxID=2820884 RepID=UPI001F18C880|nr:TIGR03557 family F420-dependent LLM class oxidoreductase [Spiractinospora alimapuensis]QVQ50029.1 TIGR03557 family F420-dependent LLM class oxidoreductase [Spiractinospora alimapuensis]
MKIGFKLMAEKFGPTELVRQAVRAEELGFDFVEISDHYHPWLYSHGHSPLAWTVLGAIANATERIRLGTGVTCPFLRYHPAIIAQAAATTALLSEGRHFLGVGAGERLNEHVVGAGFPSATERHRMLREAMEIIRRLWSGGMHSFDGEYLTLEDARVYDLPDVPPPVIVAISGEESAKVAAEYGDGVFATEPRSELPRLYERAGGYGPRYNEVPLAINADRATALRDAREMFRFSAGGWKVMSELPNPVNFEAASQYVTVDDIAEMMSAGPDPQDHIAQVRTFADAGFDHLALVNAGGDVDEFLDYYQEELAGPLGSLV